MKLIWDAFMDDYDNELANFSLVVILEAFWYYSGEGKQKSDEIFEKYKDDIGD